MDFFHYVGSTLALGISHHWMFPIEKLIIPSENSVKIGTDHHGFDLTMTVVEISVIPFGKVLFGKKKSLFI